MYLNHSFSFLLNLQLFLIQSQWFSMNKNDKKSFLFGVFGLGTQWTDIKFAFITMEPLLRDWRGTNITKGIISGFEILFHLKGVICGAYIGFISFTLGTVVELALLASPCYFGLTLFYWFVANDAYLIIRGHIVENVLRILLDRDVMHDVTLVAEVLGALFAAKTSSHFVYDNY